MPRVFHDPRRHESIPAGFTPAAFNLTSGNIKNGARR